MDRIFANVSKTSKHVRIFPKIIWSHANYSTYAGRRRQRRDVVRVAQLLGYTRGMTANIGAYTELHQFTESIGQRLQQHARQVGEVVRQRHGVLRELRHLLLRGHRRRRQRRDVKWVAQLLGYTWEIRAEIRYGTGALKRLWAQPTEHRLSPIWRSLHCESSKICVFYLFL